MFWRSAPTVQRTVAQDDHNNWLRSMKDEYKERASQAASLRSLPEDSTRFSTGSDVSLEEAINAHESADRLHANFQQGLDLEEDFAPPVYRSLNAAAVGLVASEEPERPVYRSLGLHEASCPARPGGGREARHSVADPVHAAEAQWLAGPNPPLLSRQRAQSDLTPTTWRHAQWGGAP
jgi:hypothetical protein